MAAKTGKLVTAPQEDYLEAILRLIHEGRVARVRDIAALIGVRMPAVTSALKTLSGRGLVNYDPYQVVTLTGRGREVAEAVNERHLFFREFLTGVLGLDAETAEANACRLEHAVDAELVERLRAFSEFLRTCPRAGEDLIEKFEKHCGRRLARENCTACLRQAAEAFESHEVSP